MKPIQRVNYAHRIDRVLRHLETLDADTQPEVNALADVAALSPFHFHRIYRLMTGETLGETLKRIRLVQAVPQLAGEAPITAVAGAAGYATPQAFARALKAETGFTASEIRISSAIRSQLDETLRRPAGGDQPIAVEIVSTEPLQLVALRNVGAYAELNAAYHRLFSQVFAELPMDALRGLYGYKHDDPRFVAPTECRAEVAIDVGGRYCPSGNLHAIEVPGGRAYRLRHLGDYDAIQQTVDALYATAIEAGEDLADRPPLFHYLDDPEDVAEADLRCDIYLPTL